MSAEFRSVAVDRIDPSPFNPRKRFTGLEGLGASIQANGLVEPLLVRPVGERLELVAGERRWRAAKLVGVPELPCLVRAIGDREALELAVLENVQRESMEALEEAEGFGRLLEQGYTVELLAERVGCSKSQIYNRLALRKLSAKVAVAVGQGFVEASVAQRLVKLSHEDQDEALKRLVAEDGKPLVVKEAVRRLKTFEDELTSAEQKQRNSIRKAAKTRERNEEGRREEQRAKLAERIARQKLLEEVFWKHVDEHLAVNPVGAGLVLVAYALMRKAREDGDCEAWPSEFTWKKATDASVARVALNCALRNWCQFVPERAAAVMQFIGVDLEAAVAEAEAAKAAEAVASTVSATPAKSAKPAKVPKAPKASPPAKRKGGRK